MATRWYTRAEVAEVLGMSERFIDRLISGGVLSAVKLGRAVRIDARSVREYIDRSALLRPRST